MMLASVGGEFVQALSFAFGMFWEILWALILGFALSGAVQALVSKGGDAATASGRLAAFALDRLRARRRLLVVLVCSGSSGEVPLSQGRRLHGGDGVRV